MLEYAYKVCDLFRLTYNCEICPLDVLCHERVPIIRQALANSETRAEALAKEIYERTGTDEEYEIFINSYSGTTDCIPDKPKHRRRKRGRKPKHRA